MAAGSQQRCVVVVVVGVVFGSVSVLRCRRVVTETRRRYWYLGIWVLVACCVDCVASACLLVDVADL